jgi:hypothetical protein
MICPLCSLDNSELFDQDKLRTYYKCQSCELIFVPRTSLISQMQEKDRYEAHENSETDQGYVQYLKKIAESIRPHVNLHDNGLDFGCGKSKLLEKLLGPIKVSSYDIYFHPEESLLTQKYDFIIMSEVIEHLRNPLEEMQRLTKLSSTLIVKTMFYPQVGFSNWFYKRDITHVQFFNECSFQELANICGLSRPIEIGEDLYLFKK